MSALYLNLHLYLYLYLHLYLYLYLYLYLPKNPYAAMCGKGFSEFAWQSNRRVRPLNNVAGRISTALCYDLGGRFTNAVRRKPRYQNENTRRSDHA